MISWVPNATNFLKVVGDILSPLSYNHLNSTILGINEPCRRTVCIVSLICKANFAGTIFGSFLAYFLLASERSSILILKVFSIIVRALKSWKLNFFSVTCLPASGRINQCFSGKISSPTRRNDNSLVKSFLEQELKRNLFQFFFPFSSLTKCQHHCCSHLAQHLLLKNCNEHCILQAKPCWKTLCNYAIGNQITQSFSSQYTSHQYLQCSETYSIPVQDQHQFFLPITSVGWRSHIFK